MQGLIFNIQRYCLHDGRGIRTVVFFKGCPIHCPWCSNPESQKCEIEKVKIHNRCIHCNKCSFDVDECPSGAVVEFGKYMTVDEVINEVMRDSIFFNTSGGGVTLSGGEVLAQASFALELLKRLKDYNINTAIETSGYGSTEKLKEMAQYLDTILYDLKIMDEKKSKDILGADINLIKTNFEMLAQMKKNVIPRIPLIPGYTMDWDNIKEIIEFVKSFDLKEIHLLPFHQYGSSKYEYLNRDYSMKNIKPPNEDEVEGIRRYVEGQGLDVVVGGL